MAPNRHRSHGVAAPTCSTTCSSGWQRLGQPRLDLPRQRRLQPVHAQRMERIRRRIRGGRRRHRIRAGVYNTLNGNLAYGNLVDDVSVAAEGGDGGNLVTNGGFESPSESPFLVTKCERETIGDTPFCSRLTILRIFGGMCVKKDGKTGDLYPLPCFAAPSFAHDCAKPA